MRLCHPGPFALCLILPLLTTQAAVAAEIECLGAPIKAVTFGNSHGVLAKSPSGVEGMFYIPYYSTTGSALVGIQPRTGEHVSIKLGSSGGYGCTLGQDGRLYFARGAAVYRLTR